MPARKSAKAAAAAISATYGVSTFPTKMPQKHSTLDNGAQRLIVCAHKEAKLASLDALVRPEPQYPQNPPPTNAECGYGEQSIYMVDLTQLRGIYFRSRSEEINDPPEPTRIVGGIVFDTRTNPLYYEDIWENMVPKYTKRGEIYTIEPYIGQFFTLVLSTTYRAVPMVITSVHEVHTNTGSFVAQEVDIFNGKPHPDNGGAKIIFRIIRRRKTAQKPAFFEWITDNPHAKGTVYWNAFVEWDWI